MSDLGIRGAGNSKWPPALINLLPDWGKAIKKKKTRMMSERGKKGDRGGEGKEWYQATPLPAAKGGGGARLNPEFFFIA